MTDGPSPPLREHIAEGIRAALAGMAVVLVARSQVGAIEHAAPRIVSLCASVFVWGMSILASRWSEPRPGSCLARWRDCIAPALITLIVSGQGTTASLGLDLAIIAVGTVSLLYVTRQSDQPPASRARDASVSVPLTSVETRRTGDVDVSSNNVAEPISTVASAPLESNNPGVPELTADEVQELQNVAESWTRVDAEGEVSIEAVVTARFRAGERHTVIHLPLIPPLPEIPQVECEPLDAGCDVTITPDAVFRHGIRLSVTRQSGMGEESHPIGVVIYTSSEEEIELT